MHVPGGAGTTEPEAAPAAEASPVEAVETSAIETLASDAPAADAVQDAIDTLPTDTELTDTQVADLQPDSPAAAALPEAEPEVTFADLGLSPEIVQAVEEMGYRTPTPIQAQGIPVVLMGRDMMGVAQTGTGKTASFVLPMMDILSGSRARARMPRSLILEPTRELALQVAENFVKYGKHLKLNHALLIGGESLGDQKDALMRGVDVLIATPGRLIDLFERGGMLLTDTRILVIDEADRMLDMGFIPDVERIVAMLPHNRQTLFFSATMAPEIKRLADAFLQNPKLVTVSRPASVATTIVAGLALVQEIDKRESLRRLIRDEDVQNALIFCNRKRDVDILYKSLKRHGFSVGALHGDLSQPERFATLAKFKNNELRLLVCSDVAARGLDIGGLSHVFNFDVPIHSEDYVHRIGRTGRAGMTGHAYTLATPDDRRFVEAIEKLVGAPIPRLAVTGLDPVDWAEDDGKGRRGRGGRAAPAARKAAAPSSEKPAGEKPARAPRARRERTPRDEAPYPVEAAQPDLPSVPELLRPEPRAAAPRRERSARPKEDRPRDDRARGEDRFPRDDGSRAPIARPERSRDDRRDRYRRDDDLGPSIVGFGDDVPAFMLIQYRKPAAPTADREQAES